MTIIKGIDTWLKDKSSFFFFLPDGPYGRPFDNQYDIKSIDLSHWGVNIIFSDSITLKFIGEPQFLDECDKIRILAFKELIFFVEGKIIKNFTSGDVIINGF